MEQLKHNISILAIGPWMGLLILFYTTLVCASLLAVPFCVTVIYRYYNTYIYYYNILLNILNISYISCDTKYS